MMNFVMFFMMIISLLFSTHFITAINSFAFVVTMIIPTPSLFIIHKQQHQSFYCTRCLPTKCWNLFNYDNNNCNQMILRHRHIHHYATIKTKRSMIVHDDDNGSNDDNHDDNNYIIQNDRNYNNKQKIINSTPFNLLESSAMYDDKKPSRRNNIVLESTESTSTESPLVLWKNDVNPYNDWGIERQQQSSSTEIKNNNQYNINNNDHHFPDTMDDVSNDIYEVCMAVLYQNYNATNDDDGNHNHDYISPDPNIVRNSYVDNIYNKRPIRSYPKNSGRIGIEIDGASLLLLSSYNRQKSRIQQRQQQQQQQQQQGNDNDNNIYIDQRKMIIRSALYDDDQFNSIALIQLALRTGQKLSSVSSQQWSTSVSDSNNTTTPTSINNNTSSRKVLIYFNTIQHALLASKEYQRIKLEQQKIQQWNNNDYNDDITILSLDHDIPLEFINNKNNNNNNTTEVDINGRKRRRSKMDMSTLLLNVNPTESIILIVNPTDYNIGVHKPPGPSYNTLYYLQKIISNAGIHQLPVIMLSPRLFVNEVHTQHNDQQTKWNDYSNGYQQSSTYGGIEPPNNTPWILRDFSPPSYCWIGNAMRINHHHEQKQKPQSENDDNNDNSRNKINADDQCQYSHLVLVQSVLYPKHSWHLFASKVCYRPNDHSKYQRHNTNSDTNRNKIKFSNDNDNDNDDDNHQRFLYEYLCSTKAASGRPTRSIMKQVFQQYASYRPDD